MRLCPIICNPESMKYSGKYLASRNILREPDCPHRTVTSERNIKDHSEALWGSKLLYQNIKARKNELLL